MILLFISAIWLTFNWKKLHFEKNKNNKNTTTVVTVISQVIILIKSTNTNNKIKTWDVHMAKSTAFWKLHSCRNFYCDVLLSDTILKLRKSKPKLNIFNHRKELCLKSCVLPWNRPLLWKSKPDIENVKLLTISFTFSSTALDCHRPTWVCSLTAYRDAKPVAS